MYNSLSKYHYFIARKNHRHYKLKQPVFIVYDLFIPKVYFVNYSYFTFLH